MYWLRVQWFECWLLFMVILGELLNSLCAVSLSVTGEYSSINFIQLWRKKHSKYLKQTVWLYCLLYPCWAWIFSENTSRQMLPALLLYLPSIVVDQRIVPFLQHVSLWYLPHFQRLDLQMETFLLSFRPWNCSYCEIL